MVDMMLRMQTEADVGPHKEELAQRMFDHIPVGVGTRGMFNVTTKDLDAALEMGMAWTVREVHPCLHPHSSTQNRWRGSIVAMCCTRP